MYKQALKNMYKAAADENDQALKPVDGAALLNAALGGVNQSNLTGAPKAPNEEVQLLSNYLNHGYTIDDSFDQHADLGATGELDIRRPDNNVTLLGNPNVSPFEILNGQGAAKLPAEGQPLTTAEPIKPTRNAILAALADKHNYGALAALGAAGLGGLGGAAFGGNADERILNAITGAAGGAGAVGGARGAMELLEGNVNPLLAAGLGGVTGGIGSGALARLLAKTLMK